MFCSGGRNAVVAAIGSNFFASVQRECSVPALDVDLHENGDHDLGRVLGVERRSRAIPGMISGSLQRAVQQAKCRPPGANTTRCFSNCHHCISKVVQAPQMRPRTYRRRMAKPAYPAVIPVTASGLDQSHKRPGSWHLRGLAALGVRFAAGCLAPPQTSPICSHSHILASAAHRCGALQHGR
jgi:hypothetical protein